MSQPASQPAAHSRLPSELWQKVFKVILTDLDSPTSRAYKALATVSGINTNARNAVATMHDEKQVLVSKAADKDAMEQAITIKLPDTLSPSFNITSIYDHATYRLFFEVSGNDATITKLSVQHRPPQEPNIDILYPDTEFPAPVPDPVKCEYSRRVQNRPIIQQTLERILDRSIWFVQIISKHLLEKGITVENKDFAKDFDGRMCELPILKKAL
jgi:hypothetical protein